MQRNQGIRPSTTSNNSIKHVFLADSIFWDLDLGSEFLRQGSEMTLPKGSVSDLPFSLITEVLGAGPSQDCALSVTDPSQKAISEPFVRQVQVPIFAVTS